MGIITSAKRLFTVSKTDYTPIQPTRLGKIDGALILLLLLTALRNGSNGYNNTFWLAQYTYQVEERLEAAGIPVHRYDWESEPYPVDGGEFPRSQQLRNDLDLLASAGGSEPILHTSQTMTVGETRTAYHPTGYTDLYIQKYGKNTSATLSDVEEIIREVLDEYVPMTRVAYHDELVETCPEQYV